MLGILAFASIFSGCGKEQSASPATVAATVPPLPEALFLERGWRGTDASNVIHSVVFRRDNTATYSAQQGGNKTECSFALTPTSDHSFLARTVLGPCVPESIWTYTLQSSDQMTLCDDSECLPLIPIPAGANPAPTEEPPQCLPAGSSC